jgi:hypothetical protein
VIGNGKSCLAGFDNIVSGFGATKPLASHAKHVTQVVIQINEARMQSMME